jgi:hypothetical protein
MTHHHSSADSASDFERVFREACDEAGRAYDNEALLKAIADLKAARSSEYRCAKCGAGADERFDCCEVHALTSTGPQPPSKMLTMLAILDAAGGQTEASDSKWCWLNYFCDDVEPVDTFNQAIDAKLIRVTHDSSFDTSTAFLTDAGRASLAVSRPQRVPQ